MGHLESKHQVETSLVQAVFKAWSHAKLVSQSSSMLSKSAGDSLVETSCCKVPPGAEFDVRP